MSKDPNKPITAVIKLQIEAGKANPAPPVGPALGQHGVTIMDFCKAFNERTKESMGTIIPVEIYVYKDRSFSFITKTPPASILIKKALKLSKGSSTPHTDFVGTLTKDQLKEIAETKMPDLNASSIEAAMNIVAGSARSMGVKVES